MSITGEDDIPHLSAIKKQDISVAKGVSKFWSKKRVYGVI
jgi:hypothetical protein